MGTGGGWVSRLLAGPSARCSKEILQDLSTCLAAGAASHADQVFALSAQTVLIRRIEPLENSFLENYFLVVGTGGFGPPTNRLRGDCSTAELCARVGKAELVFLGTPERNRTSITGTGILRSIH